MSIVESYTYQNTYSPSGTTPQYSAYSYDDQAYQSYSAANDFIGAAANLPDTSSSDVDFLNNAPDDLDSPAIPAVRQEYGLAPQTGVADILWLSVFLGASFIASAVFWTRVIRSKNTRG